jgi:hypothetical protein
MSDDEDKRRPAQQQERPPQTHCIGARLEGRGDPLVVPSKLFDQYGRPLSDEPKRRQRGLVDIVLKERFPEGIPSPDRLSNTELFSEVLNYMREKGMPKSFPSETTVQYFAGK